jgi:hypothetical protein
MATAYALVIGAGLLFIGIIGFVRTDFFGLHFNPLHNTIHLLSGAIGLWTGLGGTGNGAKTYAQVFGVTYTLVAIAGFVGVPAFLGTLLKLNTTYNAIHLAVGVLGVVSSFGGVKRVAP